MNTYPKKKKRQLQLPLFLSLLLKGSSAPGAEMMTFLINVLNIRA